MPYSNFSRPIPDNGVIMTIPPDQAVSFDVGAFDDVVRNNGARMVHYRAMRCPVGMIDPTDTRNPHEDHSGCSNGFIYTRAGILTGTFLSNTKDARIADMGVLGDSIVQMTAPRYYDDNLEELVDLAPYDRMYLEDEGLFVPHWQLVQAHLSGVDKLSFPIEQVIDVIDSRGHRYAAADYVIENKKLKWVGAAPGIDSTTGKGRVYSIRYRYRPYWYVDRLVHQLRFVLIDNPVSGQRELIRMNQSALLKREFIFEKSDNDPRSGAPAEEKMRQVKAPEDGLLGPR